MNAWSRQAAESIMFRCVSQAVIQTSLSVQGSHDALVAIHLVMCHHLLQTHSMITVMRPLVLDCPQYIDHSRHYVIIHLDKDNASKVPTISSSFFPNTPTPY